MSATRADLALALWVGVFAACARGNPDVTPQGGSGSAGGQAATEVGDTAPRPPVRPTAGATPPGLDSTARQVPPAAPAPDSLDLVPVADLLNNPGWVGKRVRTFGTCIGYSRVLAVGPQPRTRSDWQLLADSAAIWVVGPYPEGCAGAVAATRPSTFVAQVAADTLPGLGGQPRRLRQYLIYLPEG